jgi:hypothetical protein
MGPDFASIPIEAEQLFRNKAMGTVKLVLSTYKHLVSLLKSWGIWSDEIAQLETPPFSPRSQEELDELARLERLHLGASEAPALVAIKNLPVRSAGAQRGTG